MRSHLAFLIARGMSVTFQTSAQEELRRQPQDVSATRVRNRDQVEGRPRGCLRAFGLSRVGLREQAHAGYLPGVRKSSR